MTKQLEALRMPERIRRDWNRAVMRTCEHCDNWHMTVIHTDGSAMCAGCCDAYYTDKLKETLTAALGRIAELEATLELEREKSRRVMSQNHQLEASPSAVKLPAMVSFDDMDANSQDKEIVQVIAECKGWNAAITATRIMNGAGGTVEGE